MQYRLTQVKKKNRNSAEILMSIFRRISALFLVTKKRKMCKNDTEIVQKNGHQNASRISATFFIWEVALPRMNIPQIVLHINFG